MLATDAGFGVPFHLQIIIILYKLLFKKYYYDWILNTNF